MTRAALLAGLIAVVSNAEASRWRSALGAGGEATYSDAVGASPRLTARGALLVMRVERWSSWRWAAVVEIEGQLSGPVTVGGESTPIRDSALASAAVAVGTGIRLGPRITGRLVVGGGRIYYFSPGVIGDTGFVPMAAIAISARLAASPRWELEVVARVSGIVSEEPTATRTTAAAALLVEVAFGPRSERSPR